MARHPAKSLNILKVIGLETTWAAFGHIDLVHETAGEKQGKLSSS
jgi:hypothetical protein